jgi:lysophospholipase L1-like esterase
MPARPAPLLNASLRRRAFALAALAAAAVARPGAASRPFRVLCLGESTVQIHHFDRYLHRQLSDLSPGTELDVVNLGRSGIDTQRVRDILADALREGPADLVVVYSGHNQGGGVIPRSGLGLFRMNAWMRTHSPLYRSAQDKALAWTDAYPAPEGFAPPADAPDAIRRDFAETLADIARLCRGRSIPLVLCTQAANLRDLRPDYPLQRESGPFIRSYLEAERLADRSPRRADRLLRRLLDQSPTNARVHFTRGRVLLALGEREAASRHFVLAKEYDSFKQRAFESVNDAILAAAAPAEGVFVSDVRDYVARRSPGGVPGDEYFYDNVHPNALGLAIVTRAIAETVAAEILPAVGSALPPRAIAPPEEYASLWSDDFAPAAFLPEFVRRAREASDYSYPSEWAVEYLRRCLRLAGTDPAPVLNEAGRAGLLFVDRPPREYRSRYLFNVALAAREEGRGDLARRALRESLEAWPEWTHPRALEALFLREDGAASDAEARRAALRAPAEADEVLRYLLLRFFPAD